MCRPQAAASAYSTAKAANGHHPSAKLGRRDGWGGDLILASLRALITGIEDLPVGTLVRPHYTDATDWVFNVVKESEAVL